MRFPITSSGGRAIVPFPRSESEAPLKEPELQRKAASLFAFQFSLPLLYGLLSLLLFRRLFSPQIGSATKNCGAI
jgi:hypothetical protein